VDRQLQIHQNTVQLLCQLALEKEKYTFHRYPIVGVSFQLVM